MYPAYRFVQAQWAAREHRLSRYVTEQPPKDRFDTAIPSNLAKLEAVELLAAIAEEAGLTLAHDARDPGTLIPAVSQGPD